MAGKGGTPPKIRATPKKQGRQAGKGDKAVGTKLGRGHPKTPPSGITPSWDPGIPAPANNPIVFGDPPSMGQHSVSQVHRAIYGAGGKY